MVLVSEAFVFPVDKLLSIFYEINGDALSLILSMQPWRNWGKESDSTSNFSKIACHCPVLKMFIK